jgi:predicted transcriptional regulator
MLNTKMKKRNQQYMLQLQCGTFHVSENATKDKLKNQYQNISNDSRQTF